MSLNLITMKKLKIYTIIAISLFLVSCAPSSKEQTAPVIITSISVYQDLIQNIVGNGIEVRTLVSGMENPHTFDFSGSKAKVLEDAKLIVFNGMGLESWAEQVKQNTDRKKTQYLSIADSLIDSPLLRHTGNPHIWMDPRIAAEAVKVILPAVIKLEPDSAAVYQKRANNYIEQLDTLYQEVHYKLQPLKNKKVIAQTPGLDYFFSAFDIDRVAVIVTNPGTDPSAKRMTTLIDQTKSEDVIAIVRLPQFSKTLPETLQKESKVPLVLMSPLITGAPNVDTYIDLIWYNADQLSAAVLPKL